MTSERRKELIDNLIPGCVAFALTTMIAVGGGIGSQKLIVKDLEINYENIDLDTDYEFDATKEYSKLNIVRTGDMHAISVRNCVKIVSFKQNDILKIKLLKVVKYGKDNYYNAEYTDIETGTIVKRIKNGVCITGENTEILDEEKVSDYLDKLGYDKNKYDVNELFYIYRNEIIPILYKEYELKMLVKNYEH